MSRTLQVVIGAGALLLVALIWCAAHDTFSWRAHSTVIVYQFDTREKDAAVVHEGTERACTLDDRCEYRGVFESPAVISPYWHKVRDVCNILEGSDSRVAGVLYMDSDASLVVSFDTLLAQLEAHPNADFIGSYDQPRFTGGHEQTGFNSGVWFVRNTEAGKRLMRKWMDRYGERAAQAWYKDAARDWRCKNCQWARAPHYEQGAFEDLLKENEVQGAKIVLVDSARLNASCETAAEACQSPVCHFAGKLKKPQLERWRRLRAEHCPHTIAP